MTQAITTVSYHGFLGIIVRTFDSRERAEQWARQAGVFSTATITTEKTPMSNTPTKEHTPC